MDRQKCRKRQEDEIDIRHRLWENTDEDMTEFQNRKEGKELEKYPIQLVVMKAISGGYFRLLKDYYRLRTEHQRKWSEV